MILNASSSGHRQALTLAFDEPAKVVGFSQPALAIKLLAMGVLPGRVLKLVRRVPFGSTYYIQVDEQAMALRKEELVAILVAE